MDYDTCYDITKKNYNVDVVPVENMKDKNLNDYYDFLFEYYNLEKAYSNKDEILTIIIVKYKDIVSKLRELLEDNTKSTITTGLIKNDMLQSEIENEELLNLLKKYQNIECDILLNVHLLILSICKKNKDKYIEETNIIDKLEKHSLITNLHLLNFVIKNYKKKNMDSLPMDDKYELTPEEEKKLIELLGNLVKPIELVESMKNKDKNKQENNKIFIPGGALQVLDDVYTSFINKLLNRGLISNNYLLKLINDYNILVRLKEKSKINDKSLHKLTYFIKDNKYSGPSNILEYNLWTMAFEKTKYKRLNNFIKNLEIKYINNTSNNSNFNGILKNIYEKYHNIIINRISHRIEKYNSSIETKSKEVEQFSKENLKKTFLRTFIIEFQKSMYDIVPLYKLSKKDELDIDYIFREIKLSTDYNMSAIIFSFFKIKGIKLLFYILNSLDKNEETNSNIFIESDIHKINYYKKIFRKFFNDLATIAVEIYQDNNSSYSVHEKTQITKYFNKWFNLKEYILKASNKSFGIKIMENNIENLSNLKENLNRYYYENMENIKESDENNYNNKFKNYLTKCILEYGGGRLIPIEKEKYEITIDISNILTDINKDIEIPLLFNEDYLNTVKKINKYSTDYFINDMLVKKDFYIHQLISEKIIIYDYEFYKQEFAKQDISALLKELTDIKISKDPPISYLQVGGRNLYCKVLGRKRKIIIKNKREYVMYNGNLITLNSAKKLEQKKYLKK